MRPQNTASWTDLSTHYARQPIAVTAGSATSADITASLGKNLPIKVTRTWNLVGDAVTMTFQITNVGNTVLEMGGVGMPLAYNNNWIGKDQTGTWTESVVSDPAISLDAGYVITNRLTGEAPTLVTVPMSKSEFD